MNTSTDHTELKAKLRAITRQTLSSPARYFHVAVLVLALIMSSLLGALLITETGLPGAYATGFLGSARAGYELGGVCRVGADPEEHAAGASTGGGRVDGGGWNGGVLYL